MFGLKPKRVITNTVDYHVLRIFNATRRRLIMCRFDNLVWTLPMVTIDDKTMAHQTLLEYMNTHFPGIISIVSIVNVAEYTSINPRISRPAEDVKSNTYLYDVETEGDITPIVFGGYKEVRWTVPEFITSALSINRPTLSTRKLMESEK